MTGQVDIAGEVQAAARRAAVLGALKAKVDAEVSAARAELDSALRAARAQTGTKSVEVTVADDLAANGQRTVATAGFNADGKPSVQVGHAGDALHWVAVNYPHAVREVIDPVWLANFLKERLVIDDGRVVDSETGEVLEWARPVPGARGSLTIRYAGGDEGREVIAAAWRRGDFADVLPGLRALTSPQGG